MANPPTSGCGFYTLQHGHVILFDDKCSLDGRLRFWNSSTGTLLGDPIEDHSGPIRSIAAVSGIGGLVTTSNDGTAVLRSVDGQQIGVLPHPLQEDGSPPFVLDWFAMLILCMDEHICT